MHELVTHDITLRGERVTLRPLTESDWPVLLRWNSDPEVLYFSEGDDVRSYSLEDVQGIFRGVSQTALCFIIEHEGSPVGECWLQRMNITRLLEAYPGYDVRRIDLTIGEKSLWGRGLGAEAIGLLTELAFQQEKAGYVFGLVSDYNHRSRRAFEKNGYRLVGRHPEPPGSKASFTLDLVAKNPDLGFLSYAVQLFFDTGTERAIRAVWHALAESGAAPYLDQSTSLPHMTLSIYRSLDLYEARPRLAELAARQAHLPVSFQYHGLFPAASPTVFLGPVVTPGLLDLQAGVCHLLDGLGELPGFDYYLPGHWVPHCAMAVEFPDARMDEVMHIVQRLPLPLEAQVSEIGLIEARPERPLYRWPLAGGR